MDCCAGTAEEQGELQAGLNGWGGKRRIRAIRKSLEKETEEVYVVSSLLALLFAFLIDKGLSWAPQ